MKNERNFYIDGKWVTPHSTKTLDVLNPANEEVIGTITLGDQEDVNRAVAAAKKAFQTFSKTTVEERAALLEKIIAAYQKRMPDIGATVSQGNGRADRARQHGAGAGRPRPHRVHAERDEDLQVGRRQRPQPHRSRTDRRVRADHAVELAAEPDRRESGARDRCRLHDDSEADRDRAAERDDLRRSDGRSRRTAGRVQPGQRRRSRRRRCAVVAPRRRHGVVHRFDARRHFGGAERGTDRQARHAGTRRQVGQHPARRCRFPESRRARHGLVRVEQRPVV